MCGLLVPPLAAQGHLALTRSELIDWGRRFGASAGPPLCVALSGELGAGKTTLATAVCEGYGVTDAVTSPTFTLIHEYHAARSPVLHVDLFRLTGAEELSSLGWDELASRDALVLVEWPERAGRLLPIPHVLIELRHVTNDPERRLLIASGVA